MLGMRANAKINKTSRAPGSGLQTASLREALRNRGGARALVSPLQFESDGETVESNKPKLDWLHLHTFAPTSVKSVVDKLRKDFPKIPIGNHPVEVEAVDDLEGSNAWTPRGSRRLLQPGLVGALLRGPDRKPKGSGGLNAALQARGGVSPRFQVGRETEPIQALPSSEGVGDESPVSALSSLQEAEREEETEEEDEEVSLAVEAEAQDEEAEHSGAAAQAVAAEFTSRAPPGGEANEAAPAKEAEAKDQEREMVVEGEEPETIAQSVAHESAVSAVGSTLAEVLIDKFPAEQDHMQPTVNGTMPSLETDVRSLQKSTGAKCTLSNYRAGGGPAPAPQKPEMQSGKAAAPPEPKESGAKKESPASKLNDLREYWSKNSVGFAGKDLGSESRLSKGEAEATLQRLITAGSSVDFEQVRRLRKQLDECA